MPRLSALGSAVTGVAGTQAAINGTTPAGLVGMIGGCDWLSTTEIFGQDGTDCQIYDVDTDTQSLALAGGANETWAGGGVWQRWGTGGVIESNGLTLPAAGAATVDRAGRSAVIIDRSMGFGIRTYNASGTALTSISANPLVLEFVRCRDNVVSWADDAGWHLVNATTGAVVPFAQRTSPVNFLTTATSGSRLMVLERDDSGQLTVRQAAAAQGYVVATGANLFGPDFVFISANTVRIAYSTGAGELASELVLIDLNLNTGANTKATIVSGAPVYVAQPNVPVTSLPASAVPGSGGPQVAALYQQPLISTSNRNRIDDKWYRALINDLRGIGTVNLANATGVLPAADGGTGVTTGLTVISPTAVQFSDESLLLGRGEGAGGGDGQEISLGAGAFMDGTQLNTYSYVPMTTGAIPGEIMFIGADVMLMKVPVV